MSYYTSMSVDVSADTANSTEYLLKKEMIKELVSIQEARAKGDTPNSGTKERYINHARMLHAIRMEQPRQGYKDMLNMSVYSRDLYDRYDFDGSKSLMEIVESLHKTGSKPVIE